MNQDPPIHQNLKEWTPLTEFPSSCLEKEAAAGEITPIPVVNQPSKSTAISGLPLGIDAALGQFLADRIYYPFDNVTRQIKRRGLSGRDFEILKNKALINSYIVESSSGNLTFEIPTVKTYQVFNMPSPFGPDPEHRFYIEMSVYHLKKDPTVRHVYPEYSFGNGNMRSDFASVGLDGRLTAYEITLSTTNVLSNAAKYSNTAFSNIVFLCRDYKLKEAVKAICRQGGLDPKLLSRIDYQHISGFIRQQYRMARD
jgi:hypothetical protein